MRHGTVKVHGKRDKRSPGSLGRVDEVGKKGHIDQSFEFDKDVEG